MFSLTLSAAGPSTLTDTLSGDPVVLVDNADVIEGCAGSAGGPLVFTISVNAASGDVTVTQLRAVVHDNPADPDESATPESLASGLVGLQVTVTDGDGDSQSDSVELGALIKFRGRRPDHHQSRTAGQFNQAAATKTVALNSDGTISNTTGNIDDNTGADGLRPVRFPTSPNGANAGRGADYVFSIRQRTNADRFGERQSSLHDNAQPGRQHCFHERHLHAHHERHGGWRRLQCRGYNFAGGNDSWAGFQHRRKRRQTGSAANANREWAAGFYGQHYCQHRRGRKLLRRFRRSDAGGFCG